MYLTEHKEELAVNHSIYYLGDCPKSDALFVFVHLHRVVPARSFLGPSCKADVPAYLHQLKLFASPHHSPHESDVKHSPTVVLSSEVLESLDNWGHKELRELLKGYDVTILYFFRETLSRMYSFFTEASKGPGWNITNVSMFFDEWILTINKYKGYRSDVLTLRKFANNFGSEAIKVVDFDGAIRRNVEPHQVLACDILRICKIPANVGSNAGAVTYHVDMPPPSKKSNIGISMFGAQLFSIFYYICVEKGCIPNATFVAMAKLYRSAFDLLSRDAPIKRVQASKELIHNSRAADAYIRSKYGPLMYSVDDDWLDSGTRLGVQRKRRSGQVGAFRYNEVDRSAFTVAKEVKKQLRHGNSSTEANDSVRKALAILEIMESKFLPMALAQKHFYGCSA
jgi:hypothetical protein